MHSHIEQLAEHDAVLDRMERDHRYEMEPNLSVPALVITATFAVGGVLAVVTAAIIAIIA